MYTSWFGRALHAVFYKLGGRPGGLVAQLRRARPGRAVARAAARSAIARQQRGQWERLVRFGQALARRHLHAGQRLGDGVAVLAQAVEVAPHRGVSPHLRVGDGHEDHGRGGGQHQRRHQLVGHAVGDLAHDVHGGGIDEHQLGLARQLDVGDEHALAGVLHAHVHGVPAGRLHGQRRHQARRGRREDDLDVVRHVAEKREHEAGQREALVAAGGAEEQPPYRARGPAGGPIRRGRHRTPVPRPPARRGATRHRPAASSPSAKPAIIASAAGRRSTAWRTGASRRWPSAPRASARGCSGAAGSANPMRSGPFRDLRGQEPAHGVAQEPLALAVAHLEAVGLCERELHQRAVEVGHARLHRVGHRVAVRVAEHDLDITPLDVPVELAVQRRGVAPAVGARAPRLLVARGAARQAVRGEPARPAAQPASAAAAAPARPAVAAGSRARGGRWPPSRGARRRKRPWRSRSSSSRRWWYG